AGHPARDRVDRVLDLDAALLQLVGELPHGVLTLSNRQAVTGHDDHFPRIGEQGGDVLGRSRPDRFSFSAYRARRPGGRRTEGAEEDVAERAAHGIAHQLGEQRAGCADEGAGHDQREIPENEPAGGDGEAGKRIQHGNDDRHVRSADGQYKGDTKDQAEGQQRDEDDRRRSDRHQVDREGDDRQRQESVDDLLPWISDGSAGYQRLQLGKGHQAARERYRADHDAEDAGKRDGERRVGSLQEEFRDRDHRRSATTDAVEERHHLWDGRHLHLARADGPDGDADEDAKDGDGDAGRREMQERDRGSQGDHHADRRDLVAAARGLGRAELDQAEDE